MDEVHTLLALNLNVAELGHCFVLIVCGNGQQRRVQLSVPANWDGQDALVMMQGELADIANWDQKEPVEHSELVAKITEIALERIGMLIQGIPSSPGVTSYRADPGYRHTAILVMHPLGAVRLGYFKGPIGAKMREELIDYVQVSTNRGEQTS